MTSRRLAALMFTDMVGYSAIAHKNEILARELVDEQRRVIREALSKHGGHEHDTAGDGFFIEFSSAVSAVECAVEIQHLIFDRNRFAAPERKIQIRVGIHLGDVVSSGQGLFGNGVNLAARIEPLAPAGGICITQQIFDQVDKKIEGLTYKKWGHRKLKNIASGATIYSVVTPWNRLETSRLDALKKSARHLPLFENMSSLVGGGLFVFCASLLAVATISSYSFQDEKHPSVDRFPAAVSSSSTDSSVGTRVDLSGGWSYQVSKNPTLPAWQQTPADDDWKPFDTKSSWAYSEVIRGPYWLKRTLENRADFQTPAIVLGLIGDRHRVYLNSNFIGGADHAGELAAYAFDPKLLHEGANTLLIASESRPSLNPGLVTLGGVGAFMSDFADAKRAVAKNELQFGLLRNIYFAFSIFIFVVALAYAFFRRSSRAYFYFAFVLLLGSIQLAYFNPLLTMTFDYPFLRFLKALGLGLTPLILLSAFLTGEEKRREEFWVNLAAGVATGALGLTFFKLANGTAQFTDLYNASLGLALLANGLVIGYLALQVRKKPHALFYLLFEIISAITLAASLKRGLSVLLLPSGLRDRVFALTLASPLLFSIAVMAVAVFDHIKQSDAARRQKSRDEFALEILHAIHDATGSRQAAFDVHRKLARFLTATRSTIYLVHEKAYEVFHSLGDQTANGRAPTGQLSAHRVLDYVYATHTPVLVPDIASDHRFSDRQSASETSSYETQSCIVIPLRTAGRVVGLITFADKDDRTAFSDAEFRAALELSSTLSLLISDTPPQSRPETPIPLPA